MIDPEPPSDRSARRATRWTERARVVRANVEEARADHSSLDLGFRLVERDSTIGGGLLAGALAYRFFILLLPTALLFVSGLGLYADSVDKSPGKIAKDAGLHGLIASQVASTASGRGRAIVVLLMVPIALYALAKLYRAVAIVHAIAWHGSGRGVRSPRRGIGLLGAAIVVDVAAAAIVGWIRRDGQVAGLTALAFYVVVVGGMWLVVSIHLPHRDTRWRAFVPGAVLVGAGLFAVNVFNIYITTRLVEDRANTYGALGIATALLLSLVLVGRVIVVSAELNALLDERRGARSP
jgi:membrane protein